MTLQELRVAKRLALEASTKIEEAAKAEKRDLTDDEKAEVDKRLAEHDELVAKEISVLEDQGRCARLAEARRNLNAPPPKPEPRGNQPTNGQNEPGDRVIVPASPRHSPGTLRSFTVERCRRIFGEDGISPRERAYRAGRFFGATLFQNRECQEWCKQNGMEVRAQAEDVNTTGGYLVVGEVDQVIIDLKEERGVFRQNADVTPMLSDTKTFVSRASGVTAYAVGEGGTITESTMGWTAHELVARKWATLSRYSSELGEDAFVSIGDQITREIAYAFADKEDEAGFNGDGTSTYHGIFGVSPKIDDGTHTASVTNLGSGDLAYADIVAGDFETVVGKLPIFAERGAAWYISKVGWALSMQRLLDAVGGLSMAELAAGAPKMFMGYPVVFVQVMDATVGDTANTVKALLGDLRLTAKLGDRRGTTIALSDHLYFASDQIAIRGTTRFDIQVHQLGDTSVAGPMQALVTPGS